MRAVGLGAALPLFERVRVIEAGVPGIEAVGEPTEVTGVTGFMRSPLIAPGAGKEG